MRKLLSSRRQNLISAVRKYTTATQECKLEIISGEDKGIANLILSRPKVNALGKQLINELRQHLDQIRFSDSRVLIIKSDVPKVFCSGADLKERAEMTQQETARFVHLLRTTFSDIENLPIPTIACVSGVALGGGLELAMSCDIRIAEHDTALMGLTETSLAIIPGAGGTQRLPRIVGAAKAKELIFTARRFQAQEALDMGLINHAVDKEKSYDKALEMARQINQNGPIAVKVAKIAIQEGMQMDKASGMILEQQCYAQVIPTKDRVEGLTAFREKRKPNYKGE